MNEMNKCFNTKLNCAYTQAEKKYVVYTQLTVDIDNKHIRMQHVQQSSLERPEREENERKNLQQNSK